ncbi:MAG: hypothetical protein AAB966_04315 [Patescibacteria group bacterium]
MTWPTKKLNKSEIGRGGDAGEVFIAARKIIGDGKILADGGNGSIGGKGGKVTIISEDNQFAGQISAEGGKSLVKSNSWYQKWWGQLIIGLAVTVLGGLILVWIL